MNPFAVEFRNKYGWFLTRTIVGGAVSAEHAVLQAREQVAVADDAIACASPLPSMVTV